MINERTRPLYVTRPVMPDLEKYLDHLRDIWNAKWLSNFGPKHADLQKRLGAFLGVDRLTMFNNGTIALMAALDAIGRRGEIVTTPFTFAATVNAVSLTGNVPVFCDIREDDLTIDPGKCEELITEKTVALLAVHVFGNICDTSALDEIGRKRGIPVVYDAAHAFGSEVDGVAIGNFGDMTMYSFHPTKLFHTGEGGAVTTPNEALFSRIARYGNFGFNENGEVEEPGLNGKMNELSAALGLLVLEAYESEREKRSRIFSAYSERLQGIEGLSLPVIARGTRPSMQYYVVRIDEKRYGKSREDVVKTMNEDGIFPRKYFYPLCSSFNPYENLAGSLPIAEKAVGETLSLPFFGDMSERDVDDVARLLGARS